MSRGREEGEDSADRQGETRDLYRLIANPPTTQPGTTPSQPAHLEQAGSDRPPRAETLVPPRDVTTDPATPTRTGGVAGPLVPGQVLFNKYRVVRRLGEGGMGEVWLVRHLDLDVDRALKVIISAVAFNSDHRARFRREARVMAKFSHPNAVTVHDAVVRPDGNTAYIEMEYVRGRSLKDVLVPGVPMPLDWTSMIIAQLCNALQVAHEHGIVHRDLKPSNLMLLDDQPEGREHLKVLDFGIAKVLGGDLGDSDGLVSRTGMPLGTPLYMSPEQIDADPQAMDARCDIYSVGVILYELLTGQRVFEGPFHKLIYQHVHVPPPPFAEKNPDLELPPEVEAVVLRCLEKDPARRPPSARALAEEFLHAANPALPLVEEPPPPPLPWPLRHPVAAAIAALLLIVLIAGTAIWWSRRTDPPVASVPNTSALPDAKLLRVGNRRYADRIARVIPSREPGQGPIQVVFRLIPRAHPGDPASFYIMEDKVWNALFVRFIRERPTSVGDNPHWQSIAGGKPLPEAEARLPAMRISALEAHLCAAWLGGRLPKCDQWDKAAGLRDPGGRSGPFVGSGGAGNTTGIAVGRGGEDQGPLPVGSSPRDVSPFGCHDMAGNGQEWTRNSMTHGRLMPLDRWAPDGIILRGQSYRAQAPLLFDDLKSPDRGDSALIGDATDDIGFRVVIEIDSI
jgi:serine/threonine protein kinase